VSTFSDFIRNAPPDEKEAVYKKVMDEASRKQNETLRELTQESQKLGFYDKDSIAHS